MTHSVLHGVVPERVDSRPGKGIAVIFLHQIHWTIWHYRSGAAQLSTPGAGRPAEKQSSIIVLHDNHQYQQQNHRTWSANRCVVSLTVLSSFKRERLIHPSECLIHISPRSIFLKRASIRNIYIPCDEETDVSWASPSYVAWVLMKWRRWKKPLATRANQLNILRSEL